MTDNKQDKWGQIAEEAIEAEQAEQSTQADAEAVLSDSGLFADEIDVVDVASAETVVDTNPSELLEEIAKLKHDLDASQQKTLRVMAEADNVKRRAERDVTNAHKFALEKFCMELLPVIDSLERALTVEVAMTDDVKAMHEGLTLTMQLFEKAWGKFAIEQVNPEGQAFNPEFHEAVTALPSADHAPNTVMNVIQKGYLLNGRLVRPAMVVVSSAAPTA